MNIMEIPSFSCGLFQSSISSPPARRRKTWAESEKKANRVIPQKNCFDCLGPSSLPRIANPPLSRFDGDSWIIHEQQPSTLCLKSCKVEVNFPPLESNLIADVSSHAKGFHCCYNHDVLASSNVSSFSCITVEAETGAPHFSKLVNFLQRKLINFHELCQFNLIIKLEFIRWLSFSLSSGVALWKAIEQQKKKRIWDVTHVDDSICNVIVSEQRTKRNQVRM